MRFVLLRNVKKNVYWHKKTKECPELTIIGKENNYSYERIITALSISRVSKWKATIFNP